MSVRVRSMRYSDLYGGLMLDAIRDDAVQGLYVPVIAVHGGGWWQLTRSHLWAMLASLASMFPCTAFTIDYPTSLPNSHWPNQRNAVDAAREYVAANAQGLRVDPDRMVLLGTSAGAHLVLMSASGTPSGLRAVVGYSPATDLGLLLSDPSDPSYPEFYLGMDRGLFGPGDWDPANPLEDSRMDAASPVSFASASLPPTFVAHSANEYVPVTQALVYEAAMRDAGAADGQFTSREYSGDEHGVKLWSVPECRTDTLAFLEANA